MNCIVNAYMRSLAHLMISYRRLMNVPCMDMPALSALAKLSSI